jgi:nitrogen fixation negative regulator NifL
LLIKTVLLIVLVAAAADVVTEIMLPYAAWWSSAAVTTALFGFGATIAACLACKYSAGATATACQPLYTEHACLLTAIAQAADGIVMTDTQGTIRYVNPAFTRMTGYRADEVVGQNPRLLKSDRQDPTFYQHLWQTVLAGQVWHGQLINRRKDGTCYTEEMTIAPVQDARGALTHFMAIKQDVTERLAAEEALRQREEQYRSLVAHIPDALWTADTEGRTVFASANHEQICGYTPEELCQHGVWFDHIHPEDVPRVRSAYEALVADGTMFDVEYRLQRKDGRWIWLHDRAIATYEKGGQSYIDGITSDITTRKQVAEEILKARAAAEAATRAKSQFLANMSHEVRTPLNGILGMTELTLETTLTPDQRDYLTTIHTCADTLLGLLNDILEFSEIEAAQLRLEPLAFALPNWLHSSLTPLAVRAHQKGLALVSCVSPSVPDTIVGDPSRLRQIVVNLVGNAIKFTEQGEVEVHLDLDPAATDSGWLHLAVHDTGIGIPAAQHQHILEPFTQADGSMTRRHGGTGLGLAITQQLVAYMGGRLRLESVPGQGSTFHVHVPVGVPSVASRDTDPGAGGHVPILPITAVRSYGRDQALPTASSA